MAESLDLDIKDLEEKFNNAASFLQSLAPNLKQNDLLNCYGYYKQATCGPCNVPAPAFYQFKEKHKWEAWNHLGDMSKEAAMEHYIKIVKNLDPNYDEEHYKVKSSISSKRVSTLQAPDSEEEVDDCDKTLLDWIKQDNVQKVKLFLSENKKSVNIQDEDELYPIHWASDRGNIDIVKCLIEAGADINALDDTGQTPLHYASSCGREDIVSLFLSLNAQIIKDQFGQTPKDVAFDDNIKKMF